MLATAREAFTYEGRQVQPGDRLDLPVPVACLLAAQGKVRTEPVVVCRGALA